MARRSVGATVVAALVLPLLATGCSAALSQSSGPVARTTDEDVLVAPSVTASPVPAAPTSAPPTSTPETTTRAAERAGTSGTEAAETAFQAQLAQLDRSFGITRSADVSIAARDLSTGQSVVTGASAGMVTASAVKVEILIGTLLKAQDAGRPLSASEEDLATRMITISDNDAATTLFDRLGGGPGLATVSKRLGLRSTEVGASGFFGLTTTSAQDQVALLDALTASTSVLNTENREYALGLMQSVAADQRWGVTAAADPGATTAVKNGWLPNSDDDNQWAVTSMGVVTAAGHRILLVVFTQHQPDRQTGIDYIEQASKLVAARLTA
ncbi:serine hydrolase [Rhodococcus sp. X156]|uniref:serine hydrolase n=1 Tax=Rhodococcus sp. X156 TaxID=2499145 RepID=UPI000FD9A2A6|nr:serine hydrolase [Rhodococcus sp. X156]